MKAQQDPRTTLRSAGQKTQREAFKQVAIIGGAGIAMLAPLIPLAFGEAALAWLMLAMGFSLFVFYVQFVTGVRPHLRLFPRSLWFGSLLVILWAVFGGLIVEISHPLEPVLSIGLVLALLVWMVGFSLVRLRRL